MVEFISKLAALIIFLAIWILLPLLIIGLLWYVICWAFNIMAWFTLPVIIGIFAAATLIRFCFASSSKN